MARRTADLMTLQLTHASVQALRDFSPRAPKGCEINDNISSAFDSDLEVGLNDTDPSLISDPWPNLADPKPARCPARDAAT